MFQPEISYGRFRRMFRKTGSRKKESISPPVTEHKGGISWEITEEEKIKQKKIEKERQLAEARKRSHEKLLKLEESTREVQVDQWHTFFIEIVVPFVLLLVVSTIIWTSLFNVIHATFFFESYPSDPFDPLQGVHCDLKGCTARKYYDIPRPSYFQMFTNLLSGSLLLLSIVRHFVSLNCPQAIISLIVSLIISLTIIILREKDLYEARIAL